MNDRQQPALPEGVPADLRDFIECKSASVTLPLGKIEWLPVPGADVTLAPGATPDSATINVDLGIASISLPISVVDGQLNVDSTGLPDMLADAGTALKDWVRELNDWFASKGRRLGRPTIKDDVVTLVKEAIPPAGAAQPLPPVPPPTPPPQGGPAQPPPPAGQPNADESGGCLKWLGLALVLALGAGVVYIGLNMLGGPGAGSSPSPTTPLVASTVPPRSRTAPPPSPSAGSSPSGSSPSGSPESSPSGGPSTPPSEPPATAVSSPPPRPLPGFDAEMGRALLEDAGWPVPVEGVDQVTDDLGDAFLPDSGAPAADHQDWVDLTGAGAFVAPLNAAQAARLSAWLCTAENEFDDLRFRVACNQDAPLVPGNYVAIATTWAASVPDPLPAGSLCSFSVQTNTDGDPATGFQSDLPFNYLIGGDRYHEMLVFMSQGEFRNYTLATDHGLPPRPDTGGLQGNLPTNGRAFWWPDQSLILWVIPQADFGDNWSTGGFCRAQPAGLAVDALGHPGEPGFGEYRDLSGE